MKQYKEFHHVISHDRFKFEKNLAEGMRETKENGYGIEVLYHPVYNGCETIFCALVLGYVEE